MAMCGYGGGIGVTHGPDNYPQDDPEPARERIVVPLEIKPLLDQAEALQKDGRVAESEPILRQAVEICPKSAVAHNNLGACLGNLQRYKEAYVEFKIAARLVPENARNGVPMPPNYRDPQVNLDRALSELASKRYPWIHYSTLLFILAMLVGMYLAWRFTRAPLLVIYPIALYAWTAGGIRVHFVRYLLEEQAEWQRFVGAAAWPVCSLWLLVIAHSCIRDWNTCAIIAVGGACILGPMIVYSVVWRENPPREPRI